MELSKKVIVSGILVGLLGIIITVFSIYHTEHMGNSLVQYPMFLYGTAVLSMAVGGYVVYIFQEKIDDAQLNKILTILPSDEKKVMEILLKRKEIEQKKLGTLSGLSAVKTSRTISSLEKRGIIDKKKQGYTNLIILKL